MFKTRLVCHLTDLRIRKMAWQLEATYLWHLVFTDRCAVTMPKQSTYYCLIVYFNFMNLGFNDGHEANGPNFDGGFCNV
jgi:hypothetical protein